MWERGSLLAACWRLERVSENLLRKAQMLLLPCPHLTPPPARLSYGCAEGDLVSLPSFFSQSQLLKKNL